MTDFGLTESIGATEPRYETYVTANYRPPELFKCKELPIPPRLFHASVDAWSLGCVIFKIVAEAGTVGPVDLFEYKDAAESVLQAGREFSAKVGDKWGRWHRRLSRAPPRWRPVLASLLRPVPQSRLSSKFASLARMKDVLEL